MLIEAVKKLTGGLKGINARESIEPSFSPAGNEVSSVPWGRAKGGSIGHLCSLTCVFDLGYILCLLIVFCLFACLLWGFLLVCFCFCFCIRTKMKPGTFSTLKIWAKLWDLVQPHIKTVSHLLRKKTVNVSLISTKKSTNK